jgi:hypothetical protein
MNFFFLGGGGGEMQVPLCIHKVYLHCTACNRFYNFHISFLDNRNAFISTVFQPRHVVIYSPTKLKVHMDGEVHKGRFDPLNNKQCFQCPNKEWKMLDS